ncbi:MAG: demethoxyubiquinone hydroxylase family protein [Alphaproteobacteria bacterium]|nr:demethoxyubiquinone hydroxylase family protein [Alphaproteobacteria bacterium]
MTETTTKSSGENRLPGDPSPAAMIARMIRVDHAGEYGARRIYQGQLAVLGRGRHAKTLRHMAAQEEKHLKAFESLLVARRVRPTVLSPLWHVAGFAIGAGTALMGDRAAMACTVAVEEAIDDHYRRQSEYLGEDEAALKNTIDEARRDENDHRQTALAADAERAPAYPLLHGAIKRGTKLAIWLSERF